MSDLPVELDLKFLPSWLKEEPSPNRYADFEGESPDRARRDDRRGGGGFSGERRGPRPAGGPRPGGPGGPRPGGARPGGGKFEKRGGPGGPKGGPRGDRREDRGPRPPMPAREPFRPLVRVEILPEPAAASGIAKQIKASSRACGVFNVAKMFMERADRFRLRLHALDENGVMFQVGDGPVGFDRAAVEAGAFRAHRDIFYVTETTQGEPPKGNFTSVARDRFSGVLLGPSSHHSYQTALRKLYEARYARRMEWEGFLRNIEMVSDPAAVEQWKQQASSVTVYKTIVPEGQEPLVFKTEAEAEQHFRATHLAAMVKSGRTLEVSAAAQLLDRGISYIVGDAVEQERRLPLSIVNALRPYFNEAGLHLFKWKRKMLFASGIRPLRHPADQTFSDGISAILTTVGENPGIKRPALATRLLLGIAPESPEATAKKEALAADLHYLIQIGYVVEFQNGALELPPTKKEAQQQAQQHAGDKEEITTEAEEPEEAHESSEAAHASGSQDANYQILPLTLISLLAQPAG